MPSARPTPRPARRALVLALALGACGPKVDPRPPTFDEDLGARAPEPADGAPAARPEAAPGKGLRTGVIDRARLVAVLDAGVPQFLRQLEVTNHMRGDTFLGWQLVRLLDRAGPLADVDLQPGDVLLSINGQVIARPDQLQHVWDSLRTANALQAMLWRGDAQLTLAFTIEPAVAPAPPAR